MLDYLWLRLGKSVLIVHTTVSSMWTDHALQRQVDFRYITSHASSLSRAPEQAIWRSTILPHI